MQERRGQPLQQAASCFSEKGMQLVLKQYSSEGKLKKGAVVKRRVPPNWLVSSTTLKTTV